MREKSDPKVGFVKYQNRHQPKILNPFCLKVRNRTKIGVACKSCWNGDTTVFRANVNNSPRITLDSTKKSSIFDIQGFSGMANSKVKSIL